MNKPNIYIPDHKKLNDPEVLAMIQAFYSRSDIGIEKRLIELNDGDTELKEEKIKKAIGTYYIGYGHASIADCANVAVFVEGVSMLAAKALQDSPLYNGQERSTRYQDFSKVPFYAESNFSKRMVEEWRSLYTEYLPHIQQWVENEYGPIRSNLVSQEIIGDADKVDKAWDKTKVAIAFDIARGLLPCGATTSLSMYMSLRKFRDHLSSLIEHPLLEVRNLAVHINDSLYERYPNTFRPIRKPQDKPEGPKSFYNENTYCYTQSNAKIETIELGNYGLQNPGHLHWFSIYGDIDFGSYRDLQRHRNGINQMPLVTSANGANRYYTYILEKANPTLYDKIENNYRALNCAGDGMDKYELQYAHPMMTQVPVALFWSKEQLKYVIELRSKTSVHPTLRQWTHSLYDKLSSADQAHINIDLRDHYEQSDRGSQDIVKL